MSLRLKLGILVAILLGLIAPAAKAQTGASITGQAISPFGLPVANARIWVCPYTASGTPCTPTSNIYSDPNLTVQVTQPYAADQFGNYTVFVNAGLYLVLVQVNQTVYYSYTWSASNAGSQFLTLQHDGSPLANQGLLNFLDNGTIAPDSGYSLAKFIPNGVGGLAAEYLASNFQMQVIPPVTGQNVVIYPTGVTTIIGEGGSATANNTSAELSYSATDTGEHVTSATWTFLGALEAAGVNPANATAAYGYSVSSFNTVSSISHLTCGSGNLFSASTGFYMQPFNALTGASGSGIDALTCIAAVDGSIPGPKSASLNVSGIALVVYYTGSPVTGSTAISVAPCAYYNSAINTLGVDPTCPFPGLYAVGYTIGGTLPSAASAVVGQGYFVNNASSSDTNCTATGSSSEWCVSNGTSYTVSGNGSGSGAVSSVANSDGSLSISPTTGNAIAGINPAHANTYTVQQTAPAWIANGTAQPSEVTITPNSHAAGVLAGSAIFAADSSGNAEVSENGAAQSRICTAANGICTGTSAFSAITSGTNTSAAMVVGTGASFNINQTGGTVTTPANTDFFAASASGTASRLAAVSFGSTAFFSAVGYGGTQASPTAVASGTQIGGWNAWAYNGTGLNGPIGAFRCFANQTQTTSAAGSYCDVATTPNGSLTEASILRFENDGGIDTTGVTGGDKGPGTFNAAGLYVNGVAVGTSTGTVSDSGGTTTANQIALSTTTAHQIQYSTALPNGTTATTQAPGTNNTEVATNAFVLANAGSGNLYGPVDAQTGTTYTLLLTDAPNGLGAVTMNNAATNTVTVPPNSSVAFPVGGVITFVQLGAGQTTIAAGSGVTINTPTSLSARAQYSSVAVKQLATNVWIAYGDLQ